MKAAVEAGHRFEFDEEPDQFDLAFLEDRMAQSAVTAAGVGDEKEFAVLVRENAEIVAGASGSIWGGGCQLHVVWVHEKLRGEGIGRALMAEVEREAKLRGCRLVMGLTYDALIRDFYDRLGYRTVGLLEDCPIGTTTRWYCKEL